MSVINEVARKIINKIAKIKFYFDIAVSFLAIATFSLHFYCIYNDTWVFVDVKITPTP